MGPLASSPFFINFWPPGGIFTSLGGNYLQAFLSFKNALLRHHVTNFENVFDTIQDSFISPILKKELARSVETILRYQLNKPQGAKFSKKKGPLGTLKA